MWHIPFYDALVGHHEHGVAPHAATTFDVVVTLCGRAMFSAIFIASGIMHLARYRDTVEYASASGVAGAEWLVPLTGLMILGGGLSLLLGYMARTGAWLLVIFLIPTAFLMHRFWDLADPGMAAVQQAHFMKNIALAGAALLFTRLGSGPASVDRD